MEGIAEINKFQGELKLADVIQAVHLQDTDEPLNVCDVTRIIEKCNTWRRYLPRVKPFYAVKCNSDRVVVKILAELGIGFDCASKNEIEQVLDAGVESQRIIFANPCKPVSHMDYARDHNVEIVTFDNEFEVYKIFKNYPESKLLIRFLCEAQQAQCPLGKKFGCDVESDATALMLLAKSLNLNVAGTSFHVGSGCGDYPAYGRAINYSKDLHQFGKWIGFDMTVVDIGGGFSGDDDDKFKNVADIVNVSIDKHFPNECTEIIAEPGRFFVSAAYTLICKIYAKREIRSAAKLDTKMYYINDGVYGSFNCILYDHQQVTAFPFKDDENNELPKFKSVIWGPSCDAFDKIFDELYLPNLSCGDFIGFPNMGAYTVPVASPFNGFPVPKTLFFMQTEN